MNNDVACLLTFVGLENKSLLLCPLVVAKAIDRYYGSKHPEGDVEVIFAPDSGKIRFNRRSRVGRYSNVIMM
jgi:hypothetical protein